MKRIWVLAILTLQAGLVHAQESAQSENKVKIEDVSPDKNKTSGTDVDEEITNKKMRAESGSKSKLSISNTIIYNGGTIEKPMDEHRPNITAGTGNTAVAALQDQLAGKYNFTQKTSLSAGLGVRWITPFQSIDRTPKGYDGSKTDAYDPYLKYQYIYKWSGIQSVFSITPTWTTQTNLRAQGQAGYMLFQQNNVYEIGRTGASLGVLLSAQAQAYDKNSPELLANQSDYLGGVYPFLEYTINEHFNLRTISGVWVYEHLRSEPRATSFYKDTIYQSIGVGISVSRDVFLYPNIQFIPEYMRADRTNVAMTANINLF